jgi:hypothetical protein
MVVKQTAPGALHARGCSGIGGTRPSWQAWRSARGTRSSRADPTWIKSVQRLRV